MNSTSSRQRVPRNSHEYCTGRGVSVGGIAVASTVAVEVLLGVSVGVLGIGDAVIVGVAEGVGELVGLGVGIFVAVAVLVETTSGGPDEGVALDGSWLGTPERLASRPSEAVSNGFSGTQAARLMPTHARSRPRLL